MRRILVGETDTLGEKTSYYILEQTTGVIENYGVEIVRGAEKCCIEKIAVSGDRVWSLAELLLKNTVTPIALMDVVDDWLLC